MSHCHDYRQASTIIFIYHINTFPNADFEWVHFTCVRSKYLGRAVKVTKFCNKWKAPGRKWQFIQALQLQNNKKMHIDTIITLIRNFNILM